MRNLFKSNGFIILIVLIATFGIEFIATCYLLHLATTFIPIVFSFKTAIILLIIFNIISMGVLFLSKEDL